MFVYRNGRSWIMTYTPCAMPNERSELGGRKSCFSSVSSRLFPLLSAACVIPVLSAAHLVGSLQVTSVRWTPCCVWTNSADSVEMKNILTKRLNCWRSCWTTPLCSLLEQDTRTDTSVSWYTQTRIHNIVNPWSLDIIPTFLKEILDTAVSFICFKNKKSGEWL